MCVEIDIDIDIQKERERERETNPLLSMAFKSTPFFKVNLIQVRESWMYI